MGRIDKTDPYGGSFRALLASAFPLSNAGKVLAVGLDANGRVVIGVGHDGTLKGLICLTEDMFAGDAIDVMKRGEIIAFGPSDAGKVPGTNFGIAATNYYGHPDGTVTASLGPDGVYVGHTVENTRLIVDVDALAGEVGS